jgi:hypothetical protein
MLIVSILLTVFMMMFYGPRFYLSSSERSTSRYPHKLSSRLMEMSGYMNGTVKIKVFVIGTTLKMKFINDMISAKNEIIFIYVDAYEDADVYILEDNVDGRDSNYIIENESKMIVFWTGENVKWHQRYTKRYDMISSCSETLNISSRVEYARLPYYYHLYFDPSTCFFTQTYDANLYDFKNPSLTATAWMKRTRNVSFFANHLAFPRQQMFDLLTNMFGKVDSGGQALHNIDWKPGGNKHEILLESKFVICPENSPGEGYVTEKLFDSFMTGSIPIYWRGNAGYPEPNLINHERILFYDPRNEVDLRFRIEQLINNETAALEFFSRPILLPSASEITRKTCDNFSRKFSKTLVTKLGPHICNNKLKNSKSQEAQDMIVYEDFFRDLCGGTFVELGASDGITNSNTYGFETDMKWRGVLIEVSPSVFHEQLSTRIDRPRSTKVNGVVGNEERNVTYIDIGGALAQLSCVKEFASAEHLARIERYTNASIGAQLKQEVQVMMRPLTAWLDECNVYHVNFLSLDVDGAELTVLHTIDFSKIRIDVMTIAMNGKFGALTSFLGHHGFKFHKKTALDAIFCHISVCTA